MGVLEQDEYQVLRLIRQRGEKNRMYIMPDVKYRRDDEISV